MTTALVTIVHGRHDHLRRQLDGIARASSPPDAHIVVAIDDPAIDDVVSRSPGVQVVHQPGSGELALAAARNVGACAAIGSGADLLVFLDVDCIPSAMLFAAYAAAAAVPAHRGALLCGTVAYLPPSTLRGYELTALDRLARPHPARPDLAPGVIEPAQDHRLFWSLSFATRAEVWNRIGGFCEDYVGYGAEDTDFAEAAHRAGVGMRWVGGAGAFHQHHPVSTPPVEHLAAIVRNANVFFDRWGWWPMTGWLNAFAELGLAGYDPERGWYLAETVTAR